MKTLKITLFQEKDNGEAQILHTQWGEEVESERKQVLFNKIMKLIKDHNMKVEEQVDKFKELRRKR